MKNEIEIFYQDRIGTTEETISEEEARNLGLSIQSIEELENHEE